jgi:hypothetical protein
MDIMSTSHHSRRRSFGYRCGSTFALALASIVVAGATGPGRGIVSAQESSACALLVDDELKPLAAATDVAAGVSNSAPSYGFASCRYAWGDGIGRLKLVVTVIDTARMFPGMTPDQIRQRLLGSVRVGTNDVVIPEVGDAGVFRPDSFVYAVATAIVKGRLLEVQLDGLGAVEKKDQVIGLLKSAASRL